MSTRLEIDQKLTLSPQQCFALWADPNKLQKWWGPKDHNGLPFGAEILEWSVVEGATWAINMIAPDGTVYRQAGQMIEVDPPHRIRFSFHWIENGISGPMTEVSVRFDPDGTGTRMRFTQSGFADAEMRDSHRQGWDECFDRLAEAAAEQGTRAA